jgi:two-component sensor histidine kinase
MMGQKDVSEVPLETFIEFIHPDDRQRVRDSVSAVLKKIGPYETEYRLSSDGGSEIWVMDRGETTGPIDQNSGLANFATGMVLDITERKKNEQHQKLLINELNHRVKNTLATIQSMASQTLRTSPNLTEARIRFEARLMSLSKVHDVLTREKWESAPLADIVDRAIGPYRTKGADRFIVSGPDIGIAANIALAFAMTIHELCTNAVKYGALSNHKGKVRLVWSVSKSKKSKPLLKFRWSEKGGPAVVAPTTRGFGTKLIERSLASDLGGSVKISFAKTGVTCIITTKLDNTSEQFEASDPNK